MLTRRPAAGNEPITDARLRSDGFSRSVPSLSDPAADGEIHSSVVRGSARGLVHLPRFLPARAAGGIPLRARSRAPLEPSRCPNLPLRAAPSLTRRAAGSRPRLGIADPSRSGLEASRSGSAHPAHPSDSDDEHRLAVRASLLHEPARAGMGRAHASRRPRVSPLCPFQSRVAPRSRDVPHTRRASLVSARPGLALVGNLRRLRRRLPLLRNPQRESPQPPLSFLRSTALSS